MKLDDVRSIAKTRGVHPDKLSKTELIKTLQTSEDNFDCLATTYDDSCVQLGVAVRVVLKQPRKENYHELG